MRRSVLFILFALIVAAGAFFSIKTSFLIEEVCPPDLVNRVVGARLQKDGRDPYFYKWQPTDGTRYYDPRNFNNFSVSRSTASPFFHVLLYPLTELSQRTISKIWLIFQYVLLALSAAICCRFTTSVKKRALIIIIAVSLTFTQAWINSTGAGQMYLLVAFMGLLFYFILSVAANKTILFFFAGLTAISLLLIRPLTLIFFLPFLYLLRRASIRQIILFMIPVLLLPLSMFFSTQQRLWQQYYKSIVEHLKVHRGVGTTVDYSIKDPRFENWEGWNRKATDRAFEKYHPMFDETPSNFFVFINQYTKIKLSPSEMLLAGLAITGAFLLLFFCLKSENNINYYNIALVGWTAYMICDLDSPIYRLQYYAVQWFFPLLLSFSKVSKKYIFFYLLLLIGLILNTINLAFMTVEHVLGEYIWLATFVVYCLVYKSEGMNTCNAYVYKNV